MKKVFAALLAVFLMFASGVSRADVVSASAPLVSTNVLTLSSDGMGQVLGTVGNDQRVVGDLFDVLTIVYGLNGQTLTVLAGSASWVVTSPSFVGQNPNGFTLSASVNSWSNFTAFGLGAKEHPSELFAQVPNPDGDVSYRVTSDDFDVTSGLIAVGLFELIFSLNNVSLDLGQATGGPGGSSGGGTGTVPEPGVLALVALALLALAFARRSGSRQSTLALAPITA